MTLENNNSLLNDSSQTSSEDPVEVHQELSSALANLFGATFFIVIIYLAFRYVNDTGFIKWVFILLSMSLLVYNIEALIFRLFLCPQNIVIKEDTLHIYMLFNKKYILRISEIDSIKGTTILVSIPSSGWVLSKKNNLKFAIAKPFYDYFDLFLITIQKQNPKCIIDGVSYDWVYTDNPPVV